MTGPVIHIARNEFSKVLCHPVVIIAGILLVVLSIINAVGGVQNLIALSASRHADGFFIGYSQIWYYTNEICGIMAAFLGVLTISEERSKGTLNVLLTKPLYRKDTILGKFIGLGSFMLLFLTLILIVNSLALSYFYGLPNSIWDYVLRTSAYIFVLSIDLFLVLGITMLIGTIFKELLLSVSIALTYLSVEWFWNSAVGYLYLKTNMQIPLSPYILTGNILGIIGPDNGYNLFNTNTPFDIWLISALPQIGLMILLVIILIQVNCFIFAKEDV